METEWRRESLVIAKRAEGARRQARHHPGPLRRSPGCSTTGWSPPRSSARARSSRCDDYLGALDYRFTAEDEALVDSLVVTGHPSTPGYNDPAYPIEGRVPRTG